MKVKLKLLIHQKEELNTKSGAPHHICSSCLELQDSATLRSALINTASVYSQFLVQDMEELL